MQLFFCGGEMNQKLLVALRTQDGRGGDSFTLQAETSTEIDDVIDNFLVQGRVSNHAAFADLALADLKLWFNQPDN